MIKFPLVTSCIILLLNIVPLSNGENDNPQYTACSTPYSCGSHLKNVGYPFWGDNRPKYCGITDFKLNCNVKGSGYSNMVVYQNPNAKLGLRVLGINTSSHTMEFSSFLNLHFKRCYLTMPNLNNINIIPTLTPDSGYRYINLYYGCATTTSDDHNNRCYANTTFSCSNGDGTNGTAYYHFGNSSLSLSSSCSCSYNFTFPVDERAGDELNSGGSNTDESLVSVLNKWRSVRMVYMANFTACSKCQGSGGSCGSDPSSDEFVCYCRDGPRPLLCSHQCQPTTFKSAKRSRHRSRRLKLLIGLGAVASLLGTMILVSLVICAYKRRETNKFSFLWTRRAEGDHNVETFLQSYGSLAPKRYTYANIRKITNSFKNKLGEGGYGSVYKGRLHNGRFVAVKKLKVVKGDGKDFINEVLSISRTNHVNVVTLLGFCFEGKKRALVFEFLTNGSLDKFMYGKELRQSLQWETMFNIAIGIARGLDYLHRGCGAYRRIPRTGRQWKGL